MKNKKNKSRTYKDSDDKYNVNDKYDMVFNHGTTEQTGVVRPAAVNDEEYDSYNDVFPFKVDELVPKDVRRGEKKDNH